MGNLSNKKKQIKKDSFNKIINKEKPKEIESINLIEKPKEIESINLIEAVKSKYITNKIFLFLEENLKLNLIIHNKKFQNLLEINIEYYKKKSGKLRKIEENGICKEYTLDENALIFEGEFKNGKKCGSAKEYDPCNGRVIFKGTYLNGKRHGKGKEYYENGYLKFDGEYLNGKRHGKGILYRYAEKIEFEGEYANGYKIQGKGYNWDGKLDFVLERDGKGKEYDYDGSLRFEGHYLNEKKNGIGKYYYEGKLKYEGEFKDDKLDGKVKEYDKNGKLKFEGEFKNGKKWEGKENGEDFKGVYLNGKRWNGKAKEYQNIHIGPSCVDFKNILVFEGEYINGKKKGKGQEYDYSSRTIIEKIIDEVNGVNKPIIPEEILNDLEED